MILRDYQLDGAKWLHNRRRAMLTDRPGLGKTIQAIVAAETPVLVVCPAYLVSQWAQAIRDVDPLTTVAACEGTRPQREVALAANADWTIVPYTMLLKARRLSGKLQDTSYNLSRNFATLIGDESHHLRGLHAVSRSSPKQSMTFLELARRTPRVYLLTATPQYTNVDDWFGQLKCLDEHAFKSYWQFVDRYCQTRDDGYSIKVVGSKNEQELARVCARYALGRTYEQVRLQLPDLIEQTVLFGPTKAFLTVYNRLKDNYRLDDIVFDSASDVLHTLRQVTLGAEKLAWLKQFHQDNPDTLYYTWYQDSAAQVAEALGIPMVTGATDPSLRRQIASENPSVVGTIASMSEGIDCSHMHNVVFVEESYRVGEMDQAVHRVCRWSPMGTPDRPVRVFTLLLKGTVDMNVHHIISKRSETSSVMEILRQHYQERTLTATLTMAREK